MPGPYPLPSPYVERQPGDPDGHWGQGSTQIARGLRMEWEPGWEFKHTSAPVGEPFDPDAPPPGDGWVLNEYCGDKGHGTETDGRGRELQVSYWRRKTQ